MEILSILLTAVIIIVSILLVLIVLVQRPKQEGLGAAFGGGTFDSALGAHATDIFQKITTYLAVIFFLCAIGLAMVKARQFAASPAKDVLEKVENREMDKPDLPPGISNVPMENLGAEKQLILDDPAAEKPGEPGAPQAPEGDGKAEAPKGGDAAAEGKGEKAGGEKAPKGEKGQSGEKGEATPEPSSPAPEAPKADAPKGDSAGKGAESAKGTGDAAEAVSPEPAPAPTEAPGAPDAAKGKK